MTDAELTTVSVVVQINPFLMRTGVPFRGDVQALAEQMTRYVGEQVSNRFTAEHDDAGLLVVTLVERGAEKGSFQYREGHYVKEEQ